MQPRPPQAPPLEASPAPSLGRNESDDNAAAGTSHPLPTPPSPPPHLTTDEAWATPRGLELQRAIASAVRNDPVQLAKMVALIKNRVGTKLERGFVALEAGRRARDAIAEADRRRAEASGAAQERGAAAQPAAAESAAEEAQTEAQVGVVASVEHSAQAPAQPRPPVAQATQLPQQQPLPPPLEPPVVPAATPAVVFAPSPALDQVIRSLDMIRLDLANRKRDHTLQRQAEKVIIQTRHRGDVPAQAIAKTADSYRLFFQTLDRNIDPFPITPTTALLFLIRISRTNAGRRLTQLVPQVHQEEEDLGQTGVFGVLEELRVVNGWLAVAAKAKVERLDVQEGSARELFGEELARRMNGPDQQTGRPPASAARSQQQQQLGQSTSAQASAVAQDKAVPIPPPVAPPQPKKVAPASSSRTTPTTLSQPSLLPQTSATSSPRVFTTSHAQPSTSGPLPAAHPVAARRESITVSTVAWGSATPPRSQPSSSSSIIPPQPPIIPPLPPLPTPPSKVVAHLHQSASQSSNALQTAPRSSPAAPPAPKASTASPAVARPPTPSLDAFRTGIPQILSSLRSLSQNPAPLCPVLHRLSLDLPTNSSLSSTISYVKSYSSYYSTREIDAFPIDSTKVLIFLVEARAARLDPREALEACLSLLMVDKWMKGKWEMIASAGEIVRIEKRFARELFGDELAEEYEFQEAPPLPRQTQQAAPKAAPIPPAPSATAIATPTPQATQEVAPKAAPVPPRSPPLQRDPFPLPETSKAPPNASSAPLPQPPPPHPPAQHVQSPPAQQALPPPAQQAPPLAVPLIPKGNGARQRHHSTPHPAGFYPTGPHQQYRGTGMTTEQWFRMRQQDVAQLAAAPARSAFANGYGPPGPPPDQPPPHNHHQNYRPNQPQPPPNQYHHPAQPVAGPSGHAPPSTSTSSSFPSSHAPHHPQQQQYLLNPHQPRYPTPQQRSEVAVFFPDTFAADHNSQRALSHLYKTVFPPGGSDEPRRRLLQLQDQGLLSEYQWNQFRDVVEHDAKQQQLYQQQRERRQQKKQPPAPRPRIPSEDLEKYFRVLCDLKELRETITNLDDRVKSVSSDQTSTLIPALAVVRERYWIQNHEAVSFAQHWGQENIDLAWAHYWQPEEVRLREVRRQQQERKQALAQQRQQVFQQPDPLPFHFHPHPSQQARGSSAPPRIAIPSSAPQPSTSRASPTRQTPHAGPFAPVLPPSDTRQEDAEEGDFARAAEECEAAMAKLTEHRRRVADPREDEAEVPLEASSVPVVAEEPVEEPTPSVDPVASRSEERDSPAAPEIAVPEVVAPELVMAVEVEGETQVEEVTASAKEASPPLPAPAPPAEAERSPSAPLAASPVSSPPPLADTPSPPLTSELPHPTIEPLDVDVEAADGSTPTPSPSPVPEPVPSPITLTPVAPPPTLPLFNSTSNSSSSPPHPVEPVDSREAAPPSPSSSTSAKHPTPTLEGNDSDDSLFNEVDRSDPTVEAKKAEVVESASEDSEPVRPSPRKKKGKAKAKAPQPAVEVITIDSDSDDDDEEPPLPPSLPPALPIHPPNPHRHRSSTGSPDLVVVVRPASHLNQQRKRSSAAPLPLDSSRADSLHSDADDEAAVSNAGANEAAIDSDAQLSPPLLPTYASPSFVPTLRLDPRSLTFRRFAAPSRPSIPLLDAPTRFATLKRKRSDSSSTAPSSLTASRAKELLEMGDDDEDEDEDRGGETEVVPDSEGEEALPLPSSSQQPPSKRRKVFEAWKARFEASGGVSGLGESGKKRKRSD